MIGIDFGTTHSCVAMRGAFGGVQPVAVATGPRPPYDTVVRTAVLNPQLGRETLIGQEAVAKARLRLRKDDRYLESFKPYLDEQKLRSRVRVEVNGGMVYDPLTQCEVQRTATELLWLGGLYTRDELVRGVAHIMSHLLQQARKAGADFDEIWLGMPVNFSSCARKRLIAGLALSWDERGARFFKGYRDVLRRVRFVLEPVAVAAGPMRQALDVGDRENVLVFDHGGGTLDLSLIAFERRDGFDGPVPVQELSAAGSAKLAGRAIDLQFREYLDTLPAFRKAIAKRRDHVVDGFVEECKQRLSVEDSAEAFPGVFVERAAFEQALDPLLDRIEDLVRRAVRDGGLDVTDVDRVVMTGGSSLIPAVQDRIERVFGHLDEYRLLRYDAADRVGVESAITEVAKGLVDFGDRVATQSYFEQIALWDVDLAIGKEPGLQRVIERGTPYTTRPDGTRVLARRIPLPPIPGEGTSVGLYENQTGPRFLFGLADLPPLPRGGSLDIIMRPAAPLPALRVVDPDGNVVMRDVRRPQRRADLIARADVLQMDEETLAAYYADDADYHPINGYQDFECSPLVRPLRVGDLVEWCKDPDGSGPGRRLVRRRGELVGIRHIASGAHLDVMSCLELDAYVLTIRCEKTSAVLCPRGVNGAFRLSPRPWKEF